MNKIKRGDHIIIGLPLRKYESKGIVTKVNSHNIEVLTIDKITGKKVILGIKKEFIKKR